MAAGSRDDGGGLEQGWLRVSSLFPRSPAAIAHRGSLDVSRDLVTFLARPPAAHRRAVGTRRRRRALTPYAQAVPVLRRFRGRTRLAALARDAAIGGSTDYRYVREGIDALAD